MVFVGTEGTPANHCSRGDDGYLPFVEVDETPAVKEQLFLLVSVREFTPSYRCAVPELILTQPQHYIEICRKLHVVLAAGTFNLQAPLPSEIEHGHP